MHLRTAAPAPIAKLLHIGCVHRTVHPRHIAVHLSLNRAHLFIFILFAARWLAVRICRLRSLLVQRLLIARLKMIIIVDAIKHFVIKRISHHNATLMPMPMPIQSVVSCIQVCSLLSALPVFAFCFADFFFRLFGAAAVLFCSTHHAVSSSETITRYNL